MDRDTKLDRIYDAGSNAYDGLIHFIHYAYKDTTASDDVYFELREVIEDVCSKRGISSNDFLRSMTEVRDTLKYILLSDLFEF